MKEVKLMIDTSGLDQVQASLNQAISAIQEASRNDKEMINEIDSRIEGIFDKLRSDMRATVRAELKEVVTKEFDKLLVKLIQDKK